MFLTLRQKTARLFNHISRSVPHICALCHHTSTASLCHDCLHRYFSGNPPRCRQCAHSLAENRNDVRLCGACLKRPPAFDYTVTVTDYTPPIDQLVQSFKFGGNLSLAPLFARLMYDAIQNQESKTVPPPVILTAVPLASKRLVSRGFNQALEIAKPLAHRLGIPLMPHLIHRMRETAPQTTISLNERRKNIRGAFAISETGRTPIQNQHIAIVDDVLTTGETMGEMARILKQAGAACVSCFVWARTPL